ncbi:MAG: VWA domain-containing protein [Pyrinomonadaceae bacterium]|nr:VWA domain-containing protein [Pyrinomonadaceae bacterium]
MFVRVVLTTLVLLLATNIFGQSGRVKKKAEKEKTKKTEKNVGYVPTQSVKKKTPDTGAKVSPSPTPTRKPDDDLINVESALVPIPVSVIDSLSGRAINDLDLKDFELKIDGLVVKIGELFRSESPVRLTMLFDNSSSVTVAREFEQKAGIKFFRQVIRPNKDLAALYSVAGISQLEQPMTKDISALIRSIKSFAKPQGATALHDGIVEASNYLEDYSGRRVIVIVSDGQDTLSDTSFDEMVKIVQESNCQVYIVHTNEFENFKRTGSRDGSANIRGLAAERRMKTLANETGGAVYSPIDERELDAAFARISAELSQQYVLGYYPEEELKDGRFRTIDLQIKTRKNLTVRSRKGYYVSKK